jgi:hypothetical protein
VVDVGDDREVADPVEFHGRGRPPARAVDRCYRRAVGSRRGHG